MDKPEKWKTEMEMGVDESNEKHIDIIMHGLLHVVVARRAYTACPTRNWNV